MDEPDETFTVTLSVPSHARWQPQRRLWQPNVDGMRVAVASPYGHERVTAWQDGADAQQKNTAGGSVSSGRARAPVGALARLSQTTVCDTMRIGYAPVSKANGSQSLDPQRDVAISVADWPNSISP